MSVQIPMMTLKHYRTETETCIKAVMTMTAAMTLYHSNASPQPFNVKSNAHSSFSHPPPPRSSTVPPRYHK